MKKKTLRLFRTIALVIIDIGIFQGDAFARVATHSAVDAGVVGAGTTAKGSELRRLHLMEGAEGWTLTTTYPAAGSDIVETVAYDDGRVMINAGQWFGNVSREVWETYIGGYQPAQKWLKDRRGRRLTFDDIQHYRRIIAALDGTRRVMGEIDKLWQGGQHE